MDATAGALRDVEAGTEEDEEEEDEATVAASASRRRLASCISRRTDSRTRASAAEGDLASASAYSFAETDVKRAPDSDSKHTTIIPDASLLSPPLSG